MFSSSTNAQTSPTEDAVTVPAKHTRATEGRKTHRRRKGLGFPKAAFTRLVKELGNDFKSDLLWQPDAVQALQEASEHMLEQRFRKANHLARLCKVDTITAAHFNGQTEED